MKVEKSIVLRALSDVELNDFSISRQFDSFRMELSSVLEKYGILSYDIFESILADLLSELEVRLVSNQPSKTHISHLLTQIENIAITEEDLLSWFKIAFESKETKFFTVGGPYDMLIFPNGNFQLIPSNQLKTYKLESDDSDGIYFSQVTI